MAFHNTPTLPLFAAGLVVRRVFARRRKLSAADQSGAAKRIGTPAAKRPCTFQSTRRVIRWWERRRPAPRRRQPGTGSTRCDAPNCRHYSFLRYERIRPKAYNWLTRIRINAATRSIERYKLVLLRASWLMSRKTRSPVTSQSSILWSCRGKIGYGSPGTCRLSDALREPRLTQAPRAKKVLA